MYGGEVLVQPHSIDFWNEARGEQKNWDKQRYHVFSCSHIHNETSDQKVAGHDLVKLIRNSIPFIQISSVYFFSVVLRLFKAYDRSSVVSQFFCPPRVDGSLKEAAEEPPKLGLSQEP